jgi:hypothetical protein
MSPTYFAVRMAETGKRLEAARKAHDIRAMQSVLAERTQLYRAHYGEVVLTSK